MFLGVDRNEYFVSAMQLSSLILQIKLEFVIWKFVDILFVDFSSDFVPSYAPKKISFSREILFIMHLKICTPFFL